ncbi:hypothetical protein [Natronomonas sp. EA1]|uniref:hypothetical protein n=1 Tax=Natronomonas sp. EA1 TaxID=3421655 RepID=UPI003EBB9ADF
MSRLVVSYPADLSLWGRQQLDTRHFRAWLLRAHADATEGDVYEEFLDVGCCGSSLTVPLRVEAVDGPLSLESEVIYEEREACGIEGGWRVQSQAAPE